MQHVLLEWEGISCNTQVSTQADYSCLNQAYAVNVKELLQSVFTLGFSSAAAQVVQQSAPSLGSSHLCSLVCTEAPMLLMGRRLM